MAKSESSNISNYLSGVNYPAKKNDILNAARKNNAPNDVIQRLQDMPDREFRQANDVQDVLQSRTQGGGMTGQGGVGQKTGGAQGGQKTGGTEGNQGSQQGGGTKQNR